MLSLRTPDATAEALSSGGPAAALAFLNEGVPLRYTAIYRFAGPILHNVLLHDKQGRPRPDFLSAVPFTLSFCQFVQRDTCFRTSDSSADRRLGDHPLKGVVVSYHSVPLLDAHTGLLWGTLSHFDMKYEPLADEEFALLQAAALLLPRYLS